MRPATHTAASRSTTPPWATPLGVLARWGRLLLLGALLGPQSLADSAAHTFRLVGQSPHLLLPGLIAYYTWEDLPFAFRCVYSGLSSVLLVLTTPSSYFLESMPFMVARGEGCSPCRPPQLFKEVYICAYQS